MQSRGCFLVEIENSDQELVKKQILYSPLQEVPIK